MRRSNRPIDFFSIRLSIGIICTFLDVSGILAETSVPEANLANLEPETKANLQKLFKYVDDQQANFIDRLKEAVAIPSLSCVTDVSACIKMIDWTSSKLESLGFTIQLQDTGVHEIDGQKTKLPPALLGRLGEDSKKKTLLLYGHLDVQPALLSDGWDSEPFNLTIKDGNMYGRGSTDDKGPVFAWINAIEAFTKTGIDIPVNLKVVFECMEECGSLGLKGALDEVQQTFLKDVDIVSVSDSYWQGTTKPCITYGLRGNTYFFVEVEGGTKDLHSGVHGGAVHEALPDLIWLLNLLVDGKGKILIPGIMDDIRPITDDELKLYEKIEFDLKSYKEEAGVNGLIHPDSKMDTLLARTQYPSLSIHGIHGAYSESGAKTVIPRKVIGKFSIRLVPDQTPEKMEKVVKDYLYGKWKERNSPNKLKISLASKGDPWKTNYTHPNYAAASDAIEIVYGVKPDIVRDGGSIPITIALTELTGKNVLHLALGQSDDGAHSQNEKMSVRNYILGTKLVAAYLLELGKRSSEF